MHIAGALLEHRHCGSFAAMDPLSAVGLAANVIQFVDFATDLISRGNELYISSEGALSRNVEIEGVAKRLVDINQRILTNPLRFPKFGSDATGTSTHEPLARVAKSYNEVAKELLEVLDKLKVHGNRRKWKSVQQAVRSIWSQDKVDRLVERMARHREEIVMQLLVLGR